MKRLQYTLAATAAASFSHVPILVSAQECTCAPTSYSVRLNFLGECSSTAVNNPGIDGNVCYFTAGAEDDDMLKFAGGGGLRNRRLDISSHIQHAEKIASIRRQRQEAIVTKQQERRANRIINTVPTVITSVTFLEVDTTPLLNVINQDSTYFNTSSYDGDILEYTSISSGLDPNIQLADQSNIVVGGVTLLIFAINVENEVVRNTVAWAYTPNYCDEEPLSVGDGDGWVNIDGYGPPKVAFCPAVTSDGPTLAPVPALEPGTTPAPSIMGKAGKSQAIFAKSTKSSKSEGELVDAKAKKQSAKSSKTISMLHNTKTAKIPKAFKGKSSKAKSESTIIEDYADGSVEAKAGKMSESSKAEKATAPILGKSKKSESMVKGDEDAISKAEKQLPADAKAGKLENNGSYSMGKAEKASLLDAKEETSSTKSAKGMSMPSPPSSSGKAGKESSAKAEKKAKVTKLFKTKSAKAGPKAKATSQPSAKAGKSSKSGSKAEKVAPIDAKAVKMDDPVISGSKSSKTTIYG